VRTAAQVQELALPVERHLLFLRQPIAEVLDLQGLAEVLADLDRLVPRLLDPLEGLVVGHDPRHLRLDLRKIVLRDRPWQTEVIVKPVLHRRPETELHPLKQPHHRPGHDVGTRMPHDSQGFRVLRREQPQPDLPLFRKAVVHPDNVAIHLGSHCGLGQPCANPLGNVRRTQVMRRLKRQATPIGQHYMQH